MKELRLKITDPDFTERTLRFPAPFEKLSIGNSLECDIPLKGIPGAEFRADLFYYTNETIWLKCREFSQPFYLYDIPTTEIQLVPGARLRWGGNKIELAPPPPDHRRHPSLEQQKKWFTCSESGFKVLEQLKQYATATAPILIQGPSGTGKEALAELAHEWSQAKGLFVPLNCGAISPHLVETELFGHVRGAYTGALGSRAGALLKAHGGTLFLDEIGDLPLDLQVKLLRFLDSGEVKPVGSDTFRKSNARMVCASHKNLEILVRRKKFRADLFYRISALLLTVPPLYERPQDITYFARLYAHQLGRILTEDAYQFLLKQPWAGNVRELKNTIERAHLSESQKETPLCRSCFDFLEPQMSFPFASSLHLRSMEEKYLKMALKKARGNRAQAARLLGVARSTVFDMVKRYQDPSNLQSV